MFRLAIFISTLLLSASPTLANEPLQPTAPKPHPVVETVEPGPCPPTSSLRNTQTPADLYQTGAACIKQGKRQEALFTLALAGAYCRYDSFRVDQQTADQTCRLIRTRILGDLEKKKRDEYKEALASTERAPEICRQVEKIGPPAYSPSYIAKYGYRTLFQGEDRLRDAAERTTAWVKSLDSVHCQTH